MIKHIKNGGIEQAFLELANADGLLNDNDKKRLEHLQSLPQNRVEEAKEKPVDTTEIFLPHEDVLLKQMKINFHSNNS